MPPEPDIKRTYAFIDGQNLFYGAKEAFGYSYPNYDPIALAKSICKGQGWKLTKIFFYTGVPEKSDNPTWNHFWNRKLSLMGKAGIVTFKRPLRYRNQTIKTPEAKHITVLVGQEKGIDVRIALDVVKNARKRLYDVAVIFSQDQDLSEVADEVKAISIDQNRWIKVACAFPVSPTSRNKRGINGADWIRIDKTSYDSCIDPRDYRLKND